MRAARFSAWTRPIRPAPINPMFTISLGMGPSGFNIWIRQHQVTNDGDETVPPFDEGAQGAHRRAERVEFLHRQAILIVRAAEIGDTGVQRGEDILLDGL